MDPVDSFASDFGTSSAGLESQSGTKKKNPLYKKLKKPVATRVVVDWSAESIPGNILQTDCSSEVKSKDTSISRVSDIGNMDNMMAEKTSYVDSNASETDNMDLRFGTTAKNTFLQKLDCSFEPVRSFTLDVNLAAVSGKTNGDKLMAIIRFSFTSKLSLKKTRKLAIYENIVINDNVRQVNKHSDWVIVVKEILIDLPKLAVESVFSKFGKIFELSEIADLVTAKWSVYMEKNSVHVMKAVDDKHLWVSRNLHWALLYILPVSTTAHNLLDFRNPISYVHNKCAIVCFVDEASKLAAIGSTLVFKGVNLCWTGLSLACCAHCKQFGHIFTGCLLGKNSGAHISFGGKTWAQVAGSSSFHEILSNFSGVGLSTSAKSVSLVSDILKKLSFVELVPLASSSHVSLSVTVVSVTTDGDSDMTLDVATVSLFSLLSAVANSVAGLNSSSSKVLTTKVGGLESKMVALEVDFIWKFMMCNVCGINVPAKQEDIICWHRDSGNLVSIITETKLKSNNRSWIRNRFDGVKVFLSGLDKSFLGAGVAIIMDTSLARHVSKVSKVLDWLLSVKLLFKNKLSVLILGLYVEMSLAVCFSQFNDINSMIARAVNESFFVVLGGNFNEDGSKRCASFKKCLDLGLANSWGMAKIINFLFVSLNLVNAVVKHEVLDIGEFFDTDYQAVFMSVDLGADVNKLEKFKNATSANAGMLSNEFDVAVKHLDLDAIVFTKVSSKFHKLKLLVSKIIKASCKENVASFDLIDFGAAPSHIYSALSGIRKSYYASKLAESLAAKEVNIRAAIGKRMESFETNKNHIIRSVLEHSFCKVVLDHLVVDNELILEPDLVKSKHDVVVNVSDVWFRQYWPLDYVFDETFSGVMHSVELSELLNVISNMSNGKAAGLSVNSGYAFGAFEPLLIFQIISIIPKPYEWESVFTNTCSIVLIETVRKILSKILSNKISLACSSFDILHGDNFSVLKNTTIQSPIFAVGSVIKDVLNKNRELWLVLQDIRKAYNSVGWEHLEKCLVKIKIYGKFIQFFSSIYKNCTNRVMTDFGLTNSYCVYDGLDQKECIFYDSLLCKVKRQESVCGYRLSSHFISRNGCAESRAGLSFFFAAGAFVDNTIWVSSSQAATQHILDVASEFFRINDISINNNKTVVIPINSRVSIPSLSISSLPISIAKKGEFHQYLGIFLSTKGLSKPNLAKTNLDVHFFTNLVLKKAVSDKQFLYLVLVVLHLINALIHRGLKFKFSLSFDFSSDIIHYPFFYGLKSFSQVQSESKVVFLVSFVNLGGVLECLFSHRSHDLQVLCWRPVHPLSFPVCICVSASNNFLAGMVHILLDCSLSLGGSLANSFQFCGGVPMSAVLDELQLDLHGPVPEWFKLSVTFLIGGGFFFPHLSVSDGVGSLNILESSDFVSICDHFLQVSTDNLSVYTNGFLSNLGSVGCRAGTTAFFEDIGLGLGVSVSDLMSFTLVELQTIVLALESVLPLSSVNLFLDSQSALDCWIECHHIVNVIHSKNLKVSWHKVKGHFGIFGNEHTNAITGDAFLSNWYLLYHLGKHFIMADDSVVSGNSRHFVRNVYHLVGSGSKFLTGGLLSKVNWLRSSLVWHSDLHMAAGFTSKPLANAHSYFMKALYYQLSVVIQKHLYNRLYSSVLCLYCGNVISGFFHSFSDILQLLFSCISDFFLSMALYKGFVFNDWFYETVTIFYDSKVAGLEIVKFVHSLSLNFRSNVWSVCVKHCAYMEKYGLIPLDGLISVSVSGLTFGLLAEVVKLLGIADAFGVHFGFRKSCLFFSGICNSVSVHIAV
ncbi:hypothetical protein G9A89_005949 [Geosiphon pyriformis]|nr:hypothetical protein G9A89_005949 [Geosiphon pyriformis]